MYLIQSLLMQERHTIHVCVKNKNPPQVVILAFKVDSLISSVTNALNNMQEKISPEKTHLSSTVHEKISLSSNI